MSKEELFRILCRYACDNILTYEERHSMGVEKFKEWVEQHCKVIPKSELIVGNEYSGACRNASRAVWDGKAFHYQRFRFGSTFDETIKHCDDSDNYDVFVPIKIKN